MKRLLSVVFISIWVAGCASATPGQKGALAGSAVGAGLGAIIGHQVGRHAAEGALIGAAAGGLGGALIGETTASKFCPTCGRTYFSDQTHCQIDGTPLRDKSARPAPAQQTAPAASSAPQAAVQNLTKFCPACGRNYPESSAYCTEDGTPLKPKKT